MRRTKESGYLIHRRVAHIMDGIMMLLLKERYFERKNREHFVYVALDIFNTIFLPCPYLRRNIIIDRNLRMRLHKLGYTQIESGVIHQDHYIRLPGKYILLALLHIIQNSRQMKQYRNKTHVGQFTIMLHTCTSPYSRHQIATEEAKRGIRILPEERRHQMRGVKITTCLTCYQIV